VSAASASGRWAWAEIDLAAVAHNVDVLRRTAAPAEVWAVVKADGYGHGAIAVARAARSAGCTGACVAFTAEGVALRQAGIDGPILVLSEQPASDAPAIVAAALTPTVSTITGVDALAAAGAVDLGVHVKVDTGMHRAGADPTDVLAVVEHIRRERRAVRLAGCFTHLAMADEPDDAFTQHQLDRFDDVLATLAAAGHDPPLVHAANSAGALAHPAARRGMVRAGIAVYGIAPGPSVDHLCRDLRPALSLRARVAAVRRVAAGERVSYGLHHTFPVATTLATVPIGYADGVRRGLWPGGELLVGGKRRPIVGVVTMDQLMVDCADDEVAPGDEVVLIGSQGGERITAADWARHLGTIAYEVTTGISARVPRHVVRTP